jgi:hypothetical protein
MNTSPGYAAGRYVGVMTQVTVRAAVDAMLTWDYEPQAPQVLSLYERAKLSQWNAATDIDWTAEVPFGSPLPDDSGRTLIQFASSPLGRRGRAAWDAFRWELQAWMVSQFLHGEQGALVVAARMIEAVPDIESKHCAAIQAVDEARHVEAFSRYLREKVPAMYPVSPALGLLLRDILSDARWDITALGMQILIEALAMAAFRLASSTFHDDLIKEITRLVARDEARHVSFGVLALGGIYKDMSKAELADREEMVLEAAYLTRRRFLLEEVWERLDVPRVEGTEFAASNAVMISYRQAIFTKVVSSLRSIGLLTDRVRDGLLDLGLISPASGLAISRAGEHR